MKSTEGLRFEAEKHLLLLVSYYHGASLAYWSMSYNCGPSPGIQDLNNMLKTSLHALEVIQIILGHMTFSKVSADSAWLLALLESYLYTGNM